MKNIIPLILICLCCFGDWGETDTSMLHDIWNDVNYMSQDSTATRGHLNTISRDQIPTIQYNQREIKSVLDNMFLGYNKYDYDGIEGSGNRLGNYRDFYDHIDNFGNYGFQIHDETDDFNAFIKNYSSYNYVSNISSINPTANNFLNYGSYFNVSDTVKLKLNADGVDDTDDWFNVDVWNDSNQSVKKVKTSIQNRINEMENIPENLPDQVADPNILFALNFNPVLNLMVRLGYWNISPVQDWIIFVKLIPSEGDYLYPLYTWWTSDDFYAKTFQLCLKGLISLFTFFYCYNYVTSTWNA